MIIFRSVNLSVCDSFISLLSYGTSLIFQRICNMFSGTRLVNSSQQYMTFWYAIDMQSLNNIFFINNTDNLLAFDILNFSI